MGLGQGHTGAKSQKVYRHEKGRFNHDNEHDYNRTTVGVILEPGKQIDMLIAQLVPHDNQDEHDDHEENYGEESVQPVRLVTIRSLVLGHTRVFP